MISKSEILGILGGVWREAGLKGRGGRWRHAGAELYWVVQVQRDWLDRLSIVADAAPMPTGHVPMSNDDYTLRIFVENLPSLADVNLVEALALDSSMVDDTRRETLRKAASDLATFVVSHGTLESLRSAYLGGELESMSIRKDLRERLEGEK